VFAAALAAGCCANCQGGQALGADRTLGGLFGLARGLLIIGLAVFLCATRRFTTSRCGANRW